MAQFILVNTIKVGTATKFAGEIIDTVQESRANIESAGGVLYPVGVASVDAAAAQALALRQRGGLAEDDTSGQALITVAINALQFGADKGADLGDADADLLVDDGRWRVIPSVPLTGARTFTLQPTNAKEGDTITVTRLDVSANVVDFDNGGPGGGTLFAMKVSILAWAQFQFDGANWELRSFGEQV